MKNLIADIELSPTEGFRGQGDLGLEGLDATDAPAIFTKFLTSAVGVMTLIGSIWFLFVFFAGAYGFLTAGGDKANLENARKKIISGLMGLVMIIAAVFVIDLLGSIIGLPDILNPIEMLDSITGVSTP